MIAVHFPEPSWLFSPDGDGAMGASLGTLAGAASDAASGAASGAPELSRCVQGPPSTRRFLEALQQVQAQQRLTGVSPSRLRALLQALSLPPHFVLPTWPEPTGLVARLSPETLRQARAHHRAGLPPSPIRVPPMLWVWYEVVLEPELRQTLVWLLEGLRRLAVDLTATGGRVGEAWLLDPGHLQALLPPAAGLALERFGVEPVRVLVPAVARGDAREQTRAQAHAGAREGSAASGELSSAPGSAPWVGVEAAGVSELETGAESERASSAGSEAGVPATFWDEQGEQRPVQVLVYGLRGRLPPVQQALVLGERVRRAVLSLRAPGGFSPVLTGKQQNLQPREGNGHAYFLATDEDGDGRLDHMTIYAPEGFSSADLDALLRLHLLMGGGERGLSLSLEHLGAGEQTPLFRASRVFRSVTPYAWPRAVSRGRGKLPRPRDLPEGQLRRELGVRGYPAPVSVTALAGQVKGEEGLGWGSFVHQRLKGEKGHGLQGYELRFETPVLGPLTLGFACHFGLGLFQPVVEGEVLGDGGISSGEVV